MCVGYTPLIEASWMGHLSIVEHLVEHKANIEAKNKRGMHLDSASAVPFNLYVFLFACVLWILMCGVDVMLFPGYTALIEASRWGKLPVVKHLVEHKANIEAKCISGIFLDYASAVLFSLYVFCLHVFCGC